MSIEREMIGKKKAVHWLIWVGERIKKRGNCEIMYTLTLTLQFTMQFQRDFLRHFENIKFLRTILFEFFQSKPVKNQCCWMVSDKTRKKSVQNHQVIMGTFLLQFPRLTHTLDVDKIVKPMSS